MSDRAYSWSMFSTFLASAAALVAIAGLVTACASTPPEPPPEPLATVAFVLDLVESHEANHVTRQGLDEWMAKVRGDRAALVTALDELIREQAELAVAIERLRACLRSAESCGLEP